MGRWTWFFLILSTWFVAQFLAFWLFGVAVDWTDLSMVTASLLLAVFTFPRSAQKEETNAPSVPCRWCETPHTSSSELCCQQCADLDALTRRTCAKIEAALDSRGRE